MARELDAPPNTLGFTRMISPGRPARTQAANQSDPHRWRGPWSFHAAKPKSRAPQSGQSSIRQDSSSAYWTTKTSDLAIAPSRDDPVVIFSSSFNVERNIPAEISIFRGPLFSVAVAVRVGPDQHISERVRVGWRFSLAGPVPRGRESPNGPNGLIEAFVIIEARLEGYRGLVSLRCGRRPPQSAKDPDRHPGRPPGGHVHCRNLHRDRFVHAGDVGWDSRELPNGHPVPRATYERYPDARSRRGDSRHRPRRDVAQRPIRRNGIGLQSRRLDLRYSRRRRAGPPSLVSRRTHRYRREPVASKRHGRAERGSCNAGERLRGRHCHVPVPYVQRHGKRNDHAPQRHGRRRLPAPFLEWRPDRGAVLCALDSACPNRGC